MIYRVYYDMDRETLIVVYNPDTDQDVESIFYTFYDGVGEGTLNDDYLESNCQLVLECEGDLNIIGENIEELLQ